MCHYEGSPPKAVSKVGKYNAVTLTDKSMAATKILELCLQHEGSIEIVNNWHEEKKMHYKENYNS